MHASVRNARARAVRSRRTRCNACIASGTNVYVRFLEDEALIGCDTVRLSLRNWLKA